MVFDPNFWKERWEANKNGEPHRAVYHCSIGQFQEIEATHRKILAKLIKPNDSILDAGCGYGRLLTLLPENWHGEYLGVDISTDLLEEAKRLHPSRIFMCSSLKELAGVQNKSWDWAILISIRQMIIGQVGEEDWRDVNRELVRTCKRILYLEYDVNDKGEVEVC